MLDTTLPTDIETLHAMLRQQQETMERMAQELASNTVEIEHLKLLLAKLRRQAYGRDDRPAGSAVPPAAWFAYTPDRKGIHPQTHLARFTGILQADAYAGFNAIYECGRVKEAACWSHARRKFHELHDMRPSSTTEEALRRIGELYAIEAEIRGKPTEERW